MGSEYTYLAVCRKTAFDPGVFVKKSAQKGRNFHFATQTKKTFGFWPFFSDTENASLLTWVNYLQRYYMGGNLLWEVIEGAFPVTITFSVVRPRPKDSNRPPLAFHLDTVASSGSPCSMPCRPEG